MDRNYEKDKKMKKYIIQILMLVALAYAAIFYIDQEVTRRDYLARIDLRSRLVDCRFERNCRHYNKLLTRAEYNKEEWEE